MIGKFVSETKAVGPRYGGDNKNSAVYQTHGVVDLPIVRARLSIVGIVTDGYFGRIVERGLMISRASTGPVAEGERECAEQAATSGRGLGWFHRFEQPNPTQGVRVSNPDVYSQKHSDDGSCLEPCGRNS